MKIPKQYLPVIPYLILNNSKGFLEFAKTVFNASEQYISYYENGTIMHGEIRICDAVIMFTESKEEFGVKPAGIFMYVEDVNKIYDAGLRHNCISLMIPDKKEYGYSAGFEDPFGNHWWIVQGEKD